MGLGVVEVEVSREPTPDRGRLMGPFRGRIRKTAGDRSGKTAK